MTSPLALLARFSRAVSDVSSEAEILPLLANALVERAGASASAVVRVNGDDARIVAGRDLPRAFDGWHVDADAIGDDLAARFLETAGREFEHVHALPLISHGNLFGAAVLLFRTEEPSAKQRALAEALLDLAAVALGHFSQIDQLRGAHDELRRTQQALVRAEKLRALGQMAAGVAHDLKNILNPLSMQAQLIERAAKKNDVKDVGEVVAEMREVIARGVQTIERLRDYGRQTSEASAAPVDLDRIASEAATIAKPRLAASKVKVPRIAVELGAPPQVLGRADEILNAIVNLVINAIDAMKDSGGTVTIQTGVEDGRAFVRVKDTGPGMPAEVADHVFEPFFTTKGDQGTGLGLAMVYACMQHHAGSVELDTAPGKGTRFTLRFPAAVK